MSSKYKYFPTLLTQYTERSSQPVKVHTSNIVNFHYSLTQNEYYTQNFQINPFEKNSPDLISDQPLIQIPQPTEPIETMVSGHFTNQEYDSKSNKIIEVPPLTHFPIQFIPHDKWWEYENFKKFPDYPNWYIFKFKEWHKHMIMSNYTTLTYDPFWVLDTKTNYALQMFYYSTTLKYYKPWKNKESSGLLYQSQRSFIYFFMGMSYIVHYLLGQLSTLSEENYAVLNEDFWHHIYKKYKHSSWKTAPSRILINDELEGILGSFLMKFLVGPMQSKSYIEEHRKSGSLTKEEFFETLKDDF